jgi:hypothetical protein
LQKLAVVWAKNANIVANFFGESILKIIASVPGESSLLLQGLFRQKWVCLPATTLRSCDTLRKASSSDCATEMLSYVRQQNYFSSKQALKAIVRWWQGCCLTRPCELSAEVQSSANKKSIQG